MIATLTCNMTSRRKLSFFIGRAGRYVTKEVTEAEGKSLVHFRIGLPCWSAKLQEKCLRRAAILLRDEGIDAIILNKEFPYGHILSETGMKTVPERYAYFACADKIAQAAVRQAAITFESATGVIFAEQVTEAVAGFASKLIGITRYVRLDCKRGGERLERELYAKYGLCPIEKGVSQKNILICFSPPSDAYVEKLGPELVLDLCGGVSGRIGSILYRDARFVPPPTIFRPEWEERKAQMITLLLLKGIVKAHDIGIAGVS